MNKDYNNMKMKDMSNMPHGSNKTVFGELKLSQILLADIDVYKENITASSELH